MIALDKITKAHNDLIEAMEIADQLGLMAVQRDDAVAAAEQYAALETVRGTLLLPPDLGSLDRRMGLLTYTIGRPDQAAMHFEQGVAFYRKTCYRPELAWSCCDYADTLLQRDNPGDHEQAMSPLTSLHFQLAGHAAFNRASVVPHRHPEGITLGLYRYLLALPEQRIGVLYAAI